MLALLVPGAASLFYKVCLAIISILCILIGLGLLLYLYIGRDNDPNFFLYDPRQAVTLIPLTWILIVSTAV